MVYCNVCIEMGFHFDEIFEEQLLLVTDATSDGDLASKPGTTLNRTFSVTPDSVSTKRHEDILRKGYKHHASYADLLRSAALGCELCALFSTKTDKDMKNGHRSQSQDHVSSNSKPIKQLYVAGIPPRPGEPWVGGVPTIRISNDRFRSEAGIFCYPGDDAAARGVVPARPLYSPKVADVLSVIVPRWISDCVNSHEHCTNKVKSSMPTRVVDVGPSDGSNEPCILITEGAHGSWLALSHCWGGAIPAMTTTLNLAERTHSLPLQALPQTFRDAVIITRLLAFRYIWIDSLCIIQDSSDDWKHESRRMQNVYKNATLTIAATMTLNSSAGILNQNVLPKDMYSLPLNYQSFAHNIAGTFHFRRVNPRPERSPWLPRGSLTTRSWTVQEKVLSTRTIHFGQEIVWDCNTLFETDVDPYPSFYDAKRIFSLLIEDDSRDLEVADETLGVGLDPQNKPLARWYTIVNEYAIRDLTVAGDRLPAISAVAQEITAVANTTYLAGLWKEDFHRGLVWCYEGEDSIAPCYLAPSWSWASVTFHQGAAMETNDLFLCQPYLSNEILETRHHEFDAKILDCVVLPADCDIFGKVAYGWLVLRGLCIDAVEKSVFPSQSTVPEFEYGCHVGLFHRLDRQKHITCVLDSRKHYRHSESASRSPDGLDELDFGEESDEDISNADDIDHNSEFNASDEISKPEGYTSAAVKLVKSGSIFVQIGKWSSRAEPEGVIFALLLEPTETEGEYCRRGLARVPELNGMAVKGWEKQTVRII